MYFSCRKTRFFATKLACVARKGRMRFGASSPVPFLDHGSAAETLIAHRDNTASYAGYFKMALRHVNV